MKTFNAVRKLIAILLVFTLVFDVNVVNNFSSYAFGSDEEATFVNEVVEGEVTEEVEVEDETEVDEKAEVENEVEAKTEIDGEEVDDEVVLVYENEATEEVEAEVEVETNVETETEEEASAEAEVDDEVVETNEITETCETTLESEAATTEVVEEVEETVAIETTIAIATDSEIEEEIIVEEVVVATDSEIDEVLLEEVIIATNSEIELQLLNSVESKLYNDLYNLDNASVTYEDGVIYLQKDITLNDAIVINTEEKLNLNSHSIFGKNSSVFVCENANLVIEDDKEKRDPGSIVGYSEEPTLAINGGNVYLGYVVIRNSNYNNAENSATVVINDATVTINGADIKGAAGKSYANKCGADGGNAVVVNYSNDENTFTFKSGTITGGTGGDGMGEILSLPGSPYVLNDKYASRDEYFEGLPGKVGGGNGGNALVVYCKNENNIIIESKVLKGGNGGNKYVKKSGQDGLHLLKASNLPAAYNSVDEGYVKRTQPQRTNPFCQTFAIMSAIETYMQKFYPNEMAALGFEEGMINLSENGFVRAVHFGQTDPLGNAKKFMGGLKSHLGDVNGQAIYEEDGFNALAKWWGPIKEDLDPWGMEERSNEPFPDEIANPTNNVARYYSADEKFEYDEDKTTEDEYLTRIKKGVVENGVMLAQMVTCLVRTDLPVSDRYEQIKDNVSDDRKAIVEAYVNKYSFSQDLEVMNGEPGDEEDGYGHAFAVVGYDDNFPQEYFTGEAYEPYSEKYFTCMPPKRDGAFLVRNSWSENNEFTWFPYEWAIKFARFRSAHFVPHNKDEHIYYYDGGMWDIIDQTIVERDGYAYHDLVNIFKVQGDQEIKSVLYNFSFCSSDADLRIYEVEDNSAEALNKLFNSNNIAEKTLYSKDNVGGYEFQTIDLEEPVYVKDGTYVAICLSGHKTTAGAGILTATYDVNYENDKSIYPAESQNSSYVRRHLSRDMTQYYNTYKLEDIVDTFSNFMPIAEGLIGYEVFDKERKKYREPCNLTIRMITADATVVNSNVTLNANGGKFSDGSSTKTFEVASDKTFGDYDAFVEPTRDGYIFDKWVDDTTNPTREFDGYSRTSKDKTIYATWIKIYKITYNMNGHGTQVESETIKDGEVITVPSIPTETGWTFDYWQAEGDVGQFDFRIALTSDITLNAQWSEKRYFIYFDPMGGVSSTPADESGYCLSYYYTDGRASLLDINDFEKEGYKPVGWYDNKECTGDPITSIPPNTVGSEYGQTKKYLYLKWTPAIYSVTFDMAGHGTQIEPMEIEYGKQITKPNDPTCDGYKFMGWQDETGYTYDFTSAVKNDKIIKARWEKAYKITFVSDYGVVVEPMIFVEGERLSPPPEPIHERNAFKSWQLNGVDFVFGDHYATEDLTLTATWTPYNYVSFYTGSSEKINPYPVASGSVINGLPMAKDRTSERLAFAGWYYEDGRPFNTKDIIHSDIILVARWRNFVAGYDYQPSRSTGGGGSSPSPSTGGPVPSNFADLTAALTGALQDVGPVSDEARAQLAQQIEAQQLDRLDAIAQEQQQQAAQQSRPEAREQKVSVTKDASTTKEVTTANSAWTMDPVTGSFKLAIADENGQISLAQGFCNLSNPADPNAGTKSYFFNEEGEMQTGWVQTADNKWYFFDTNQGDNFGAMTTGWQQVGGSWYYMNNDGSMMTGGTTPDGYTISANGTWQQ